MKKFIAALVLVASPAFANGLSEALIMTNESIEEQLSLPEGDYTLQFMKQDLATPEEGASFAIKSEVLARSVHSGGTQLWTCETQFVKTAEFFKVSKTQCLDTGK